LRRALDGGHVAGAALDVFVTEPATSNVLFGHPHVVCTPHLGASTSEAQEQVALQVAEQMSDYLMRCAISRVWWRLAVITIDNYPLSMVIEPTA